MSAIWRADWIRQYESPWSIFEKLTYANRIDTNELLRILGNSEIKAIKNGIYGNKRKKLFDLESFDQSTLNNVFGINILEYNKNTIDTILKPLHYFLTPQESWFSANLRWCSECLNSSYHSWLHQFILLKECPFHNTALFEYCPQCHRQIPFLLNDKGIDNGFKCECGQELVDLSYSKWERWNTDLELKNESLKYWLSNKNLNERWLFIPQLTTINLLTELKPLISYNKEKHNPDFLHTWFTIELYEKVYQGNRSVFLSIDRYINQKILLKHKHCITQLRELRKEDGKEFGEICPYAYAYVFWKCSLLKLDKFYRVKEKGPEISSEGDNFNLATKIINEEIYYLINQLLMQNKGFDESSLIWITNRVAADFSINLFKEWLKIAKKGAKSQRVPNWNEIIKMKEKCFPNIVFKYCLSSANIGYCKSPDLEKKYEEFTCPNEGVTGQRKIKIMKSYTPLNVAIRVNKKINPELHDLMRYIHNYIRKLSF